MADDTVKVVINGFTVSKYESFSATSDLLSAADAFSVVFKDDIGFGLSTAASWVMIYINEALEMTGMIDTISAKEDKEGRTVTVSGTDMMGVLVKHEIKKGYTLENISLLDLAKRLLQNEKVPFIEASDLQYGEGSKLAIKSKTNTDKVKLVQIKPGETVFEVLNKYARQLGMLFFATPDGKMVFNTPVTKGDVRFGISLSKSGTGTNALAMLEHTESIKDQYSDITVMGQRPGESYEDVNVSASVSNSLVGYYKPKVITGFDGDNAKKEAELRRTAQVVQGFSLSYKMPGFSQCDSNWQVNCLCYVNDEKEKIAKNLLISERTFEYSKSGAFTTVKLMLPEAYFGD